MEDIPGTHEYYLESWRQCLRVLQSMTLHERREHFDMGTWARKTLCGTVGCIAGHCALDPWFQKNRPLGWFSDWRHYPYYPGGSRLEVSDRDLLHTFNEKMNPMFVGDIDHPEAVRRVMLKIASLTRTPVCALGWGMP